MWGGRVLGKYHDADTVAGGYAVGAVEGGSKSKIRMRYAMFGCVHCIYR